MHTFCSISFQGIFQVFFFFLQYFFSSFLLYSSIFYLQDLSSWIFFLHPVFQNKCFLYFDLPSIFIHFIIFLELKHSFWCVPLFSSGPNLFPQISLGCSFSPWCFSCGLFLVLPLFFKILFPLCFLHLPRWSEGALFISHIYTFLQVILRCHNQKGKNIVKC